MTATMERKECDCSRCQSACRNVPGWFLPGEAARAAEAAGMPLDEYFRRYLVVDYWLSAEADIFALRPAMTHEQPGDISEYAPARGDCRFLRSDECRRCQIHAVKPHECAVWVHGMDHEGMHEATAMAWRDHQAEIVALLGYQPSVPAHDFSDVMALMFRG